MTRVLACLTGLAWSGISAAQQDPDDGKEGTATSMDAEDSEAPAEAQGSDTPIVGTVAPASTPAADEPSPGESGQLTTLTTDSGDDTPSDPLAEAIGGPTLAVYASDDRVRGSLQLDSAWLVQPGMEMGGVDFHPDLTGGTAILVGGGIALWERTDLTAEEADAIEDYDWESWRDGAEVTVRMHTGFYGKVETARGAVPGEFWSLTLGGYVDIWLNEIEDDKPGGVTIAVAARQPIGTDGERLISPTGAKMAQVELTLATRVHIMESIAISPMTTIAFGNDDLPWRLAGGLALVSTL